FDADEISKAIPGGRGHPGQLYRFEADRRYRKPDVVAGAYCRRPGSAQSARGAFTVEPGCAAETGGERESRFAVWTWEEISRERYRFHGQDGLGVGFQWDLHRAER